MLASRGVLNAVRLVLILSLVAVTGCVSPSGGKSRPPNQSGIILEGTQAQSGPPGSTIIGTAEDPLLDGVVRIDLLLPLGANAAGVQRVANSLLNAAQLAEGDLRDNRIILSVRDTYGTPEGAAQAAQDAIDQGTELILGPLFSHSVAEVGPIAGIYGVNVIAFSTDSAVAGDNVFLLSFLPEQEVDRVVEYASLQGISSYGALTPETEYGARVDVAFADAVQRNGGVVTVATVYPRDPQGVLAPVREFTEYGRRAGALKGAIRRAKAAGNTNRVRRLKLRDTLGEVSYQAAIVPEDAQLMRSIAPLFPYFDAHPTKVKLLGTGKWNDPMVFEEPWLKGAWFAAPSPQDSSIFLNAYQNAYGAAPANPWLASLGYDAMALAGALIQTGLPDPFGYETLTDPEGFSGVNGIFRFGAEGLSERGLSVMEIGEGAFVEISAAPGSFGGY